jgi:hypothetical protein
MPGNAFGAIAWTWWFALYEYGVGQRGGLARKLVINYFGGNNINLIRNENV